MYSMAARKTNKRSIRTTLLQWLLPVALIFVGIAWVVHGALLERMSRDFFEYRLQQESMLIERQIKANYPDIDQHLDQHNFSMDRFHHTFAVQIVNHVWAAEEDLGATLLQGTEGSNHVLMTLEVAGRQYLAYRDEFQIAGKEGVVVVAEDFGALEEAQGRLHIWVGVVSLALLLLLVVLIVLVVNLAVRPLQQLGQELQQLHAGSRNRLDEDVPEEFAGLVQQLNALLDRLDRQLEASRQAIANLSHSVKTPLSVLMQWLRDPEKPFDREARQQLLARFDSLQQQLDAQMRRSQLSGPGAGKNASPQDQTRDMLWMLGRLYPDKEFEFEADFDDAAKWPIEEQDFNELIGNLADNAGKWADRRIKLTLSKDTASMHIQIEDDGPGVAKQELAHLGTRGRRLDEQIHGHGLGLSIVRDIVSRYSGSLQFESGNQLGGLSVIITLPLLPPGA
ncbi:sensor histidine kinase [Marinobacteraceae bacterium S3BR75-40.1]